MLLYTPKSTIKGSLHLKKSKIVMRKNINSLGVYVASVDLSSSFFTISRRLVWTLTVDESSKNVCGM